MVGGRLDGQGSYYLKSGTRARTLVICLSAMSGHSTDCSSAVFRAMSSYMRSDLNIVAGPGVRVDDNVLALRLHIRQYHQLGDHA